MKIHYLKTIQPFFSEVKEGRKTFEHRKNDRDFQVGDEVYLEEYDQRQNLFSGEQVRGTITYVLTNRSGLGDDFCVFSLKVTQHITRATNKQNPLPRTKMEGTKHS